MTEKDEVPLDSDRFEEMQRLAIAMADWDGNETKLRGVWPGPGGIDFQIGSTAHHITMRRDGAGPMGWYDVIHVYDYHDKEIATVPAHQATRWEIL